MQTAINDFKCHIEFRLKTRNYKKYLGTFEYLIIS
jgi:hypothetical protein